MKPKTELELMEEIVEQLEAIYNTLDMLSLFVFIFVLVYIFK